MFNTQQLPCTTIHTCIKSSNSTNTSTVVNDFFFLQKIRKFHRGFFSQHPDLKDEGAFQQREPFNELNQQPLK